MVWAVKDAALLANALEAVEEEVPSWTPRLAAAALLRHLAGALEVSLDGRPATSVHPNCTADEAGNVTASFGFAGSWAGSLTVRSPWLADLPMGHRQLLTVINPDGSIRGERLLSAGEDLAKFEMAPGPQAAQGTAFVQAGSLVERLRSFLGLGLKHILMGYDHLLFLFSLLVVSRNLKDTLKVITCFTVAHSITLALATFDVVRLPGRVVEPLIAASIVFVAIENLLRRQVPPSRLWLVFGFGLVHGLGFASVLSELGVGTGSGGVAVPLISFNLGVELGQLLVAIPLVPLLAWAARSRMFERRWIPACSVAAALAGAVWFVERVLA